MLMPSIFNSNFDLLNNFYDPWFSDHELKDVEKKLYGHNAKNGMSTDVRESDDGYTLEIDLPGFEKDEITAELKDGYLTISAAKGLNVDHSSSEEEAKKGQYIRRERYTGSCSRSFYVGKAVKQEDIKANFKHGILELNIPKKDPEAVENRNYIAIEG